MRKLLFVHDHKFYKETGGCYYSEGKFSSFDFDRFKNISESVTVLSRCIASDDVAGLERSSGPRIYFSPVVGGNWRSILLGHICRNFRLIARLVNESDLTVIRLPCFLSIPVAICLLVLRKPYAVEVVGDAGEALSNAGDRRWPYRVAGFLFDLLVKIIVRQATGAIYVTKNQLQEVYPTLGVSAFASNVTIQEPCPNLIDRRLERVDAVWSKKNAYHIGVIGSFNNNYKGIDTLIMAVSEIRSHGHTVFLHVLGSGDRSLFNGLISECSAHEWLFFDGRRDKSGVLSWLDAMDIYCQPSRTEGLPRALVEAMSRGCPAVGTRVGGIPELLPPERLVRPGDVCALADNILQLLGNYTDALYSSRRNFEVATEYYEEVLNERRKMFWEEVASRAVNKGST